MFSTLRTRFGIPGVISVMALVFAMFGGAYAASNSSSGPKATASAKAKKGPRGPKGPKGDTGPAGPQGPAGANGKDGASGSNGANGTSAETVAFSGEAHGCKEGGVEVKSASPTAYVCNGVKGTNGTNGTTGFTETLPSGKTETGVWTIGPRTLESEGTLQGSIWLPISFPIPLAADTEVHFLPRDSEPTTECPGSFAEPIAGKGNLCIYEQTQFVGTQLTLVINPETGASNSGAGKVGAVLRFQLEEELTARGVWAVTAP